jgi:hypothetical protein
MLETATDFLLGPTFRSLVLAISVAVSLPSAGLTWFAWSRSGKATILGIAVFFSFWAVSASFFGLRYAAEETAFSQFWFIVPNVASLGMSTGAVVYLWSILKLDVHRD